LGQLLDTIPGQNHSWVENACDPRRLNLIENYQRYVRVYATSLDVIFKTSVQRTAFASLRFAEKLLQPKSMAPQSQGHYR